MWLARISSLSTKLVCMWYYQRCCYLCLIPWLVIRSIIIYIHTNTVLLEALSAGTITYLSWREERHLTTSWSLNTDLCRLLTQCLSFRIRPCTRDLIVLTQSDKDPNFSLYPPSGIIFNSIHNYLLCYWILEMFLQRSICCVNFGNKRLDTIR